MDTKKSIDWKKEIPRITQPDGTVVYDCDIFGCDSVNFKAIECLRITGNLAVGDHFVSSDILLGESGFFEESAYTGDVHANINVSFGDNANSGCINAGGSVSFGHCALVYVIDAGSDVSFGDDAEVGKIISKGSVSFGKSPRIGHL